MPNDIENHMVECDPSCPDPKPLFWCGVPECGKPIYPGDRYSNLFGDYICEDCVKKSMETADEII